MFDFLLTSYMPVSQIWMPVLVVRRSSLGGYNHKIQVRNNPLTTSCRVSNYTNNNTYFPVACFSRSSTMSSPTSTTPSAVKLRLGTLSDLTAIARCWHAAFFDDVVIGQIMHPNRKEYPEDVYHFLLRGIRERYFDWTHQFIVVTDSDGRIIGAADWRRVGNGGNLSKLSGFDPSKRLSRFQMSKWIKLTCL